MAKITGFVWAKIEFYFNFLKIMADLFVEKSKTSGQARPNGTGGPRGTFPAGQAG
ncbi:hypothetical protein [Gillisia hiemivivida]|uniref:hypothetical protein n=1 Tax=Gillisia hiemivivida TaxID=291190 RepID=UPI001478E596|nr:hypothetical protein [Gillisia hiemivivida]